jgi:hypothetical protein
LDGIKIKIDVFLADDHLVMRYGKTRKELNWNFQLLVLDKGEMIMSDKDMRKGLKKPFFGSSGFIEQMYKTHFPC